jgi:hypothetical protein
MRSSPGPKAPPPNVTGRAAQEEIPVRKRPPRRNADGLNRFERFLFLFMGPPQVGDPTKRGSPEGPEAVHPECGRPYSEHGVTRTRGYTYMKCPED